MMQELLQGLLTFDPEEADFFFAPVYLTCYLWPVHGWTDGPW
ncbi:uncharacterized protein HaLaN_22932 [Haematococcus lacustris]|uniref:Uncharacterized protein n=1 Tax=Haematococcus lacustris TaxID=44745 RepID=A0A699ZZ36_HAELA|nr:uncharacterized protein HaLaN_22932 [Haematococcus lacustris]